jgi:hypothetical protein
MVPSLTVSELPSESYPSPSFPSRAPSKGSNLMWKSAWGEPRNRRELVCFDLYLFVVVFGGKEEFAQSPAGSWSSCQIPLATLLADNPLVLAVSPSCVCCLARCKKPQQGETPPRVSPTRNAYLADASVTRRCPFV